MRTRWSFASVLSAPMMLTVMLVMGGSASPRGQRGEAPLGRDMSGSELPGREGSHVAATAQSAGAVPRGAHLPPFQLKVQEHRLANGVTVLVVERPAAGRVAARVFYRADIAGEKPGTYGLTHLLEHYLFKGSHLVGTRGWERERPLAARIETLARQITDEKNRLRDAFRQRDLSQELEGAGTSPRLDELTAAYHAAVAEQDRDFTLGTDFMRIYMFAGGTGFTASTGSDWMKFDIDLPANRLELFMWMERDRVTNPVFRQFDPEREVVIEQIRRAFNDPQGAFQRMLNSTTYEAHPYGTADWFSDLQSATREDHWEIFYKYFIPQNTVLVIVGDVKAPEVNRLAERYFADWPAARPSPRLRTVEPRPAGPKRVEAQAPAGPIYALNVLKPALGHPDGPVLDVLAALLGGADGLLAKRLVHGDGTTAVATSATANSSDAKYSSTFGIRVTPRRNEDLPAVEAGVDQVLREVARGTVTQAAIDAAVLAMHFDFIKGFEEIGPTAVTLGSYAVTHRWEYLNALPQLWAAVTPADLARVTTTYFDPQVRTTGILKRGDNPSPWMTSSTAAAARSVAQDEPPAVVAPDDEPEAAGATPRMAGIRMDAPPMTYEPAFLGPRAPHAAPVARNARGATSADAASRVAASPGVAAAQTAGTRTGAAADVFAPLPPGPPMAGEPLAVAEQVWYAPPWMAVARGGAAPASGAAATPGATSVSAPRTTTGSAPASASAVAASPGTAATRPADYRLLTFPAAPFMPPKPEASRVRTTRGVTAFIEEDALLPMVCVTTYVDATTVHDPAGKEGLAALTAELLDRGGAGARSGDDIRSALAAAGVTIATEVTAQRTRLTATVPVAAQDRVYALLGDILTRPRFDRAAFDRAKANAAIRADRTRDATATVLQDLFNEAVYGAGHSFVRRATKASIDSLTLDDVVRFHGAHYTANRITVAISGQVQRADVTAKLNAAFEPVATGAGAPAPAVGEPNPASGLTVKIVDRPSAQAQVMMGYPGITGVPADDAALEVMHYVLAGGGFASRMMDELRTNRGLTAALYGEVRPTRFGRGAYAWRFSGNPDTIAEAIKVAFAEIDKMRTAGVTEAEFEKARTAYLEGHIPHAYDFPHARVTRFAQAALWGFYDYTSEQYLNYYAGDERQAAAIRALTLADVNAAAKKYLRPQEAVIAIVGPVARIQRGAAPDTRRYVTVQ